MKADGEGGDNVEGMMEGMTEDMAKAWARITNADETIMELRHALDNELRDRAQATEDYLMAVKYRDTGLCH